MDPFLPEFGIKLPFFRDPKKVIVSESYHFYVVESYRCPKLTVFLGRKLPFLSKIYRFSGRKLPFIGIKLLYDE